jgi:hypothetical protein
MLREQSVQVLLFVCIPLLALLVALIVLLVQRSRKTATFPSFSITISSVDREEAYVLYRGEAKQVEFNAQIGRGKRFFVPRIWVEIPREIADEDLRVVVANLGIGLANLHFDYLIYRRLKSQSIPVQEREAAIDELRKMGVELKGSPDQGELQRAIVHNWHRASPTQAEARLLEARTLMGKATGIRENVEVLARSDSTPFW